MKSEASDTSEAKRKSKEITAGWNIVILLPTMAVITETSVLEGEI